MLDGLPNGSYTLHLSGQGGLTDLAGNPLAGDDPSGDEVIPFSVQGASRSLSGNKYGVFWTISQAALGVPQDLGRLYPDELQAGVAILRYPEASDAPGASSAQDDYVIQLTESQNYSFALIGSDVPDAAQVSITDASGEPVPLQSPIGGQVYFGYLTAGTYTVSVGGWAPGEGAALSYQLLIVFDGQHDNAPPLVDGPAPALQISFDTAFTAPASPSDGGATPSVPEVIGPMAGGTTGSVTGGNGPVATTGNGNGTGVPNGGSGSSTSSDTTLVSFSPTEATVGLVGLGMGPLGGFGGQAGPLPTATVQVALNAPVTGATPSNALAVSLVTLTQMFSWKGNDEGIVTAENANPTDAEPTEPTPPSEGLPPVTIVAGPFAGPIEDVLAALPMPPTPTVPVSSPVVLLDPPRAAPTTRAENAAAPPRETPAPQGGDSTASSIAGKSLARWVVAAATLTAVYRARHAVRGLEWRKGARTGVNSVRSIRPIIPTVRPASTFIIDPAGQSRSAHVVIPSSRGSVPAVSPHR
jgi:hypothetical protein